MNKGDFWSSLGDLNLTMSMDEVERVLMTLRPSTSIMLWGSPGIGKTKVVEGAVAKRYPNEGTCRTIVLSTYEPTDLGGVPFPVHTEKGATDYVRYLVAKWAWEASIESGCTHPMFLFLDDITTAHEQVQAACYRLIDEKRIGDLQLRNNVHTIGAGNMPTDNAYTHDMPTPLGSRVTHIYCVPNPDVWINWAVNGGGIHPWEIGFIRMNKHLLYTFVPDAAEKAYACPRSLEKLSDTLYDLEKADIMGPQHYSFRSKLIAGTVGSGWAIEFLQYLKTAETFVSPEEIVENPENCRLPDSIDATHATVASAEQHLKNHPEVWEPMFIFSLRIEKEQGLVLAAAVSDTILHVLDDEQRAKAATNPKLREMMDEMGFLLDK